MVGQQPVEIRHPRDNAAGSAAIVARVNAAATSGNTGAIRRTILADGQLRVVSARDDSTSTILQQAGISISLNDEVLRHTGNPMSAPEQLDRDSSAPLTAEDLRPERAAERAIVSSRGARPNWPEDVNLAPYAVDVEVRRAVPLILHEKGLETQLVTTKSTLAAGLASAGVQLEEGDQVMPSLDTPVSPGLHVYVRRSLPVSLDIGGATTDTRAIGGTVAEVLAEHGVALGGEDRVEPTLDAAVEPEMHIAVVRVEREKIVEQERLDFEVERKPDPDLEVGQQRIEPGQEGLFRHELEIIRENGNEVSRNTTREWVESEPLTGVVYYGTKTVVRDLDTPDGDIEYTRAMNVYTTWYNASHGEKPRSSPWYGITATGMRAGRGVVAVDPRVIPLYTRLYIPGYGLAIAGDTGGGVKGAHIDLGFEEDEISPWRTGWVTVYILD